MVKRKTNFEIVPISETKFCLSALIYGRSGTGKTTFASTFPKPLLLLDVKEKGWDSIKNVPGIELVQISDWSQLEEVYWYLKSGDHKFKSVIIDQITQLQDLALIQALRDEGKQPGDHLTKKTWGAAAALMKTWLLNYKELTEDEIHIAFLAHDKTYNESEGEDSEQIDPVVGARVMPSVAAFINGAVNVIGNTFIRESFTIEGNKRKRIVEFAMRLGPHAYYTSKTRTPVGISPPDVLVDPTFDKLAAIIRGEYQASTVKRK